MLDLLLNPLFLPIIIVLSVWTLIWKGIALWKCGRNNQLAWFIVMLILNTAGILPIIYLLTPNPGPLLSKQGNITGVKMRLSAASQLRTMGQQGIDAALQSLAKEDPRFWSRADKYWNARGGSHTDGGAFVFSVIPKGNGKRQLVCTSRQ